MMGCFNGVVPISGNLRAFVAKAVYGGRVCVNKNQPRIIEGKISDYDGVSLYPSAEVRMCEEKGLPIGRAKRLINLSQALNYDYSIIKIKIKSVGKIQQMPFIAVRTKESIDYTNLVPEESMIIDSITLEDYIKFHQIEYEVEDGVYWNSGFNPTMGPKIQSLFLQRLKYKKTNKALANAIKLMLNSSFGKTITKKSETEFKIFRNKFERNKAGKWERKEYYSSYIHNNFNTIKQSRKITEDMYEIESYKVDNSTNLSQIGCMILSYSKRIMNEVFDIANDIGAPIYYTDTDSLHCNLDDIKKIEDKYREVYGKELTGKNLGQFHTDFDLEGSVGEIWATKSIFLGKKSYLDVLESRDKDGNKITGYHKRMKSITVESLLHHSKEYKNSYEGLYEYLAKTNKKKMLMNPFNEEEYSNKVLFEFKEGSVSTRKPFYREVYFPL